MLTIGLCQLLCHHRARLPLPAGFWGDAGGGLIGLSSITRRYADTPLGPVETTSSSPPSAWGVFENVVLKLSAPIRTPALGDRRDFAIAMSSSPTRTS